MVKSVPVRDQNVLAVTWPVMPGICQYKKGASPYVQHFLESEAQGSLIALLKQLGTALASQTQRCRNSMLMSWWCTFQIKKCLPSVHDGRIGNTVVISY